MKRYLRIYRRFLVMNAETLFAYRSNFINSIVSSMAWSVFAFVSMVSLTARTTSFFGWSRDEFLLLTSGYSILIGFFHTFLTRNFERMALVINKGQLDSVLLLPVDSQFVSSVRYISYTSLVRVVFGLAFTVYLVTDMRLTMSWPTVLGAVLFLMVGMLLLYSIWFSVLTLLMYNPQLSNLIDVLFTLSGFAKYPREMYRQLPVEFFWFLLPLTFIVVVPVHVLVGVFGTWEIAGLLASAVILFCMSRLLWKTALRRYSGASA